MSDIPGIGSREDQALEGVGQEDEKVGGERVPLAKAPVALNPTARLAVEEDRRVDSRGEVSDPTMPTRREPFGFEYAIQG